MELLHFFSERGEKNQKKKNIQTNLHQISCADFVLWLKIMVFYSNFEQNNENS